MARESVWLHSFSRASGAVNHKAQWSSSSTGCSGPGRSGARGRWFTLGRLSPHRPQIYAVLRVSVSEKEAELHGSSCALPCGGVQCSRGGERKGRPASVRLPGRDDELAEGAGTKVRECGLCRVQRVDLVDRHAGGPLGWVAGQSSRVARAGLAAAGTTVKFSAGSWSGEPRRVETNRPPSQTTGSSEATSPASVIRPEQLWCRIN